MSAILTQGAKDDYGFVKMYTLSYKTSGDIWEDYYENGIIKVSFNNYPFMSRIERKYCLTLFREGGVPKLLKPFILIQYLSKTPYFCCQTFRLYLEFWEKFVMTGHCTRELEVSIAELFVFW